MGSMFMDNLNPNTARSFLWPGQERDTSQGQRHGTRQDNQ